MITVFVSCCSGQWLTVLVSDCLINCIGVLTIICFNVLINLLNFHYFSGVSFYYRAMHFSAKRSIAIACRLYVCPSVCDVGEL